MSTITCKNLSYVIKDHSILKEIDAHFQSGTLSAITGVSGSGKTTLLNILGMILAPSSGELFLDQVNCSQWKDRDRIQFWRNRASFIFQDYGIIEEKRLFYNLCFQDRPSSKMKGEMLRTLSLVGLEGREMDYAASLSGGEKQRLGIARAILKQSDIIFADEPTASLDAQNRNLVFSLLQERAQKGCMVLVATHDEELVSHCDFICNLSPS